MHSEATERILSRWSVRAILVSRHVTIIRAGRESQLSAKGLSQGDKRTEGRIVVYRAYFLRLLAFPKPLRDQLLIELPTLEAFRTGEIITLRVEDVDFENGDIHVLDSKKHTYYFKPLDPTLGKHFDQYFQLKGLKIGDYAIGKESRRGRPSKKHQETPLLCESVIKIWQKYCRLVGIPEMSPRMGRAYFACVEHFTNKTSDEELMFFLNDKLESLQHYLAKLIDYETVKAAFLARRNCNLPNECARLSCPNRVDECYCRGFLPQIEVEM